jgi:putative membrane protein
MYEAAGYGPYWGMHLFWWAFWILAMISVFGFNVPERTRINGFAPHSILKRRLAKGDILEDEYKRITAQLRTDEELIQRNFTTQNTHATMIGHPIKDGLSLSATWAILYAFCALFYWIAPGAMLTLMSKLSHGMSFTQMSQTGTTFSFGDFISVLTIGAVYTFVAGIIWSLIHSYSLRQSAELKLKRLENQTIQKVQFKPQAR